jgi:hypothetical protein
MTATLLPELMATGASAMLDALEARAPRPADEEEAGGLRDLFLRRVEECRLTVADTRSKLEKGLPADRARQIVSSHLQLCSVQLRLLEVTERVFGPGIFPASAFEEARAAIHEAEGLQELLSRPRKPVDKESLRKAREAFERGEGKDVEEWLREVRPYRP